jgi:hypothetical protein
MKMPLTAAGGVAASLLFGVLAATVLTTPLNAQTTTPPAGAPSVQPSVTPRAATPADPSRTERRDSASERHEIVDASQLERGANSFTEGQARSRLEEAGFSGLRDLRKDDHGFWRGYGTRGGSEAEVALDFRGRIAAGPGVTKLGADNSRAAPGTGRSDGRTTGAASGQRPDGTPGNPPSTTTGRAVDRMQGETPRPDGTPGNPSGTAAGRAIDRATGSDTTGTNPAGSPTR